MREGKGAFENGEMQACFLAKGKEAMCAKILSIGRRAVLKVERCSFSKIRRRKGI